MQVCWKSGINYVDFHCINTVLELGWIVDIFVTRFLKKCDLKSTDHYSIAYGLPRNLQQRPVPGETVLRKKKKPSESTFQLFGVGSLHLSETFRVTGTDCEATGKEIYI